MYLRISLLALLLIVSLCCFPRYADAQGFTIGASSNPVAVDPAQVDKIAALATNMYNRWLAYDTVCDPKAVFAIAYLYMTANARRLVQNGYFDDGNKMVDFVETFAGRYIAATDEWEAGHTSNVSSPWAIYFTFLESDRSDVTQDITMGMNAHINYDLAIAAFEEGYTVPQWTDDYYRVNDLMAQIDGNITYALGRYDPQFYNTDFLSESYFQASVDLVTSWRTTAYTTALSYQLAMLPIVVDTLQAASEVTAATAATAIAIPYPYSTAPSRIAYCEANHYPLTVK